MTTHRENSVHKPVIPAWEPLFYLFMGLSPVSSTLSSCPAPKIPLTGSLHTCTLFSHTWVQKMHFPRQIFVPAKPHLMSKLVLPGIISTAAISDNMKTLKSTADLPVTHFIQKYPTLKSFWSKLDVQKRFFFFPSKCLSKACLNVRLIKPAP